MYTFSLIVKFNDRVVDMFPKTKCSSSGRLLHACLYSISLSFSFFLYICIYIYIYIVLSYLNDGLTSITFFWEKTLERMVEFHCHQPTRFGKSNYSKDSTIRRTIV